MSKAQSTAPQAPDEKAAAPQAVRIGIASALGELWTYVSPKGDKSGLSRILIAFSFIAFARAATLIIPLIYGRVVDHVSGGEAAFDISIMWWLLGAYALARSSQQAFDEGSEFVFVK
ncbi:MAG: hypothetical protein J4F41_07870, partial [Alphaproteobacteria bacterium]|nr:hypothetical protein [Alphaproteobacteria bacterium]